MKTERSKTVITLVFVFCLLFSIYCLSYNGVPSTDDEQLYACVAQNLGRINLVNSSGMYGNERLLGGFNNNGPIHFSLAALIYPLISNTQFGFLQSVFFLNPLYTSLTALIVLLMAQRQGYSLQLALIAAMMFGLATIAWPYTTTFFREPLAMLFIFSSWLALDIATASQSNPLVCLITSILFVSLFILGVFTKVMLLATLPCFLIFSWNRTRSLPLKQKRTWKIINIGILISFIILGLLLPNFAAINNILQYTHFKVSFLQSVLKRLFTLRHDGFLSAVVGILVSPGKGLFLYSPILIFALISLFLQRGKNSNTQLLAWSITFALIIAQVLAYDSKWWNQTWGTRFLIPALPFLVIASLGGIESVLKTNNRFLRYTFFCIVGISIVTQFAGILISSQEYNILLMNKYPSDYETRLIWQLRTAPIFYHWYMLFVGSPLKLAISRNLDTTITKTLLALTINLMVVVLSFWGLLSFINRPVRKKTIAPMTISAALLTICLPILLLNAFRYDTKYYGSDIGLQKASEQINLHAQPDDIILIQSYLSPGWKYWFNYGRTRAVWYSLPINWDRLDYERLLDDHVLILLEDIQDEYSRIWMLSERFPGESALSQEEIYLANHFTQLWSQEYDVSWNFRLSLYQIHE